MNGHHAQTGIFCFTVFLIIGLLALFHPMILSGFTLVQTDPGDTRLVNYILEHSYQWMLRNPLHASFWDLPIFFPVRNTAANSEILLGVAPIYWLIRLVRVPPDTAFQFWMLAVVSLNFTAAFILFRREIALPAFAAAGGAYVFAFAGLRATQLSQQQLLPQFFSVVAIICLVKLLGGPSISRAETARRDYLWTIGFFASLALQVYSSFYLAFFFSLGLFLYLVIALVPLESRRRIGAVLTAQWLPIALSSGIFVVALWWIAHHYKMTHDQLGGFEWSDIVMMVPRLTSWIDMGPQRWAYGWMTGIVDFQSLPNEPAHRIGLGFVTLFTAVAGLLGAWRNVWVKVAIVSTLTVLGIALVYPGNWSPWKLVFSLIPGGDAIRFVTRISLLVLIPLSLGVALFLSRLKSAKWILLLTFVIAVEQFHTTPSYNKLVIRSHVEGLSKLVPRDCRSFYFASVGDSSGPSTYWVKNQLDAMWASTMAGVPTVNGFSGNIPLRWAPLWDCTVKSESDLARVHINLFQWAEIQGLKKSDICLIAVPHSSLRLIAAGLVRPDTHIGARMPEIENFEIDVGTREGWTFLGPGWGTDEGKTERSWTWVVGTKAKLYVPLRSSADYNLRFLAAPLEVPGRSQSLTISLNDKTVATVQMASGFRWYDVPLPASQVKDFNKIELLFGFAASPADLGKGSDNGLLAACFEKVVFHLKRR
jgi:hypothetical protein